MTLGAFREGETVRFRIWAPRPADLRLVLEADGERRMERPRRDADGYWDYDLQWPPAKELRYGYLVDGAGPFPDPASRSQPDGVHELSAVPAQRHAQDAVWTPPPFRELVIYELHIGTFTSAGTFAAAITELPRLAKLGVNAVEVMPVAAFAGRWGWGYDGVALWAPFEPYGGVRGLREFVSAAHRNGIAVILDVVYNHFGPDGNYTSTYSDGYLHPEHVTPWGPALNFDGPGAEHVRRFFFENAWHWFTEYGIDGLRLDATHAIIDTSPHHFLAELSESLREGLQQPLYLIAETHENEPRYVRPVAGGGFGFDAVWADDFHHACRTAVAGDHEGYYGAFRGLHDLARIVERGWLYEGQVDPSSGERRGKPADFSRWGSVVFCIQNHDQIGNRAFGDRLTRTVSASTVRALATLLLLHPATPLLFQGQEFHSARPFLFFADHSAELAEAVREGRRAEFAKFSAFQDQQLREAIPDAQAAPTFLQSKLESEAERDQWARLIDACYEELLRVRRSDPVLGAYRRSRLPIAAHVQTGCLVLQLSAAGGRRTLLVNLSPHETTVRLPEMSRVIFSSDQPRFGGFGRAVAMEDDSVIVPRETAALLA